MDLRMTELKVGIFILIGMLILFIIVFSISDVYLTKPGYRIKVIFNFVSGISQAAPVRFAVVSVGQVEKIDLTYDPSDKRTKAVIHAWLEGDTKIEEDAEVTVNMLGLLGEKYLEIFPGTPGKRTLKDGDTIIGHDPVPMEKVTENLKTLSDSVTTIVERLKRGEGTIGKLLVEEAIYYDLKATAGNFKDFSEDIKRHPWKLLSKPRGE